MEKEKKKGNKARIVWVTILIVLLLGAFFGFGYALGANKILNIFDDIAKKEVKVDNTSIDSKKTNDNTTIKTNSIPVDSLIENLFEKVKWGSFGLAGKKVSDMSEDEKGLIASKNFEQYITTNPVDYSLHVSEENVRYGYDSIFGAGTYQSGQNIYSSCGSYSYDSINKEYSQAAGGCGGTTAERTVSKVVKAEKNNKVLKITAGVLYISGSDDKVYKDFEKTKPLGSTISEYLGADNGDQDMYAKQHIENNVDSSELYTYTFELDNNGFYKYIGFEKTQEAK